MFWKFLIFLLLCNEIYSLKLEKVLVLSRHNLRTPLISTLARMTPKEWPTWDAEVGHLTQKGALLETYMGQYFSEWLKKEGLLPNESCPEEKSIHIYANTKQRTRESAKSFAKAAFPDCDVAVFSKNLTSMDPTFNPIVRNTTEAYIKLAKQEMLDKLRKSQLTDIYLALNDITDLKNSETCREDNYCDLSKDRDDILFEVGEEPNVAGPFFISNAMVDAFLMSYYEGLPLKDIGWGQIKNESQWLLLTKVVKENQNVRFNLKTAALDLIGPLIKYIKERLAMDTKFTLLMGHDSNITPILTSMKFKPYVLPEQHELTPVGGKLVFQKWTDGADEFLKVEFVYQSWQQLREAEQLSMDNSPKKVILSMEGCVTDERGLCPWNDFETVLNNLVS